MFVLLTGEKPYPDLNVLTLPPLIIKLEEDEAYKLGVKQLLDNLKFMGHELPLEYANVFNKLILCKLSSDIIHIIMLFLDFNENTRLGSPSNGGVDKIKEHPVFKWSLTNTTNVAGAVPSQYSSSYVSMGSVNIQDVSQFTPVAGSKDSNTVGRETPYTGSIGGSASVDDFERRADFCWDLIELKQITPPFIPESKPPCDVIKYPTFEDMMFDIGKGTWLRQCPNSYYDEYFQNW